MRHFFTWDTFFTCLLVFAATTGLIYVPANFDFLNPLKQALGDFDITDMAQSKFRDESLWEVDTNIVLVNLSTLDRQGIATMLDRINSGHPAVVGIDAMFRRPKSPELDSALTQAMASTQHLLLGAKIDFDDSLQVFDSIETSHPMFNRFTAKPCFYNVVSDQEKSFRTVREFSPKEIVGSDTILNFAVAVAQVVQPEKVRRLLSRANITEPIRFRGSTKWFYNMDASQVLADDADMSVVRDKIVLMGYIDNQIDTVPHSLEDVFFTPLNVNYAGRTFPDMYGVVIHANVISQILHDDYVGVMSLPVALIITFVLCVLTVGLFNVLEETVPEWYDALTIVIFLLQSLCLTWLLIVIFNRYQYKLTVTITLAALALTPTLHEIYHNSVKAIFWKLVHKFTRKRS